ncbi:MULTISPECIES: carbohydrate ABC transporter permease [unclassified Paenibacillus]|uniref:carbohydrate ABC transporter permease n=1 Tax=unclassified Paenibacillus TaxID=185978 RepID=UPI001C10BC78|nr:MULTISPECIES: carbohydrate ABC transporter permease [unclassified Paenibacillus]MBU5445571.1 carbohydrate ABC transporter permease [Paenibacillus sp. MSJ-34]CAH0121307.1 Inner membrane ABC transporter permease protein YcjP [Paenibacillus sp. CECT 9249]
MKKLPIYLAAVLLSLFAVGPFLWMMITSFKTQGEIYSNPVQYLPSGLHLNGYKSMLNPHADANLNFINWFLNTAIVSFLTTLFSLIISALGAYSMSRFRYKGRMTIGYLILVTQMLPGSLLIIPLYIIMKDLHLLNSHFGLVIAYSTMAIPFCTWMLKGYFDSISVSIDEAAMVDGANRWMTFSRILLPLTLPGLVVTGIFSFLTSWNEFLFAQTFISDYEKWTLSVGIASFQGQYVVNWDYLMAGSVFTTLPIVIAFWLLQKYLVSGMTAGAVK